MASRKEQKALARERRLAEESAAAAARERAARMRKVLASIAAVAIVAGSALILMIGSGSGEKKAAERTAAITKDQLPGLQATLPPWPPEEQKLGDRVKALNLPTGGGESYHFHSLLTVYADGEKVEVPADIGISQNAGTMAPIHTHDTNGLIHVEAPERFPFRLGDIFGVWGVPFSSTTLGGYVATADSKIAVYVNGKPISQRATYLLKDGDNIVVAYGPIGSLPKKPDASALDTG